MYIIQLSKNRVGELYRKVQLNYLYKTMQYRNYIKSLKSNALSSISLNECKKHLKVDLNFKRQ